MAKWQDTSTRWARSQILRVANFEVGVYETRDGRFEGFLLCLDPRQFVFRNRSLNATGMEQAKTHVVQEAKEAISTLQALCVRAMTAMKPFESVKPKVAVKRKVAARRKK